MITITLWIPAAIAGGVALAGAISSNIAKKKAAQKQREFALQQQQAAQAYNSPKAQMDRFKQANLNPNLIYGSGQAAAGSYVEQSSEGQGGQFQPLDLSQVGGSIGQIYDLQVKKAGIDKLEADTRARNQETSIAYQRWIVEKLYLAQKEGDKAAVSQYNRALKNMEMSTEAEQRGYYEREVTGIGSKGEFQAKTDVAAKEAAIAKIKAESDNITQRNNRIRKLNEFIAKLPQGIDVTEAIQLFLLTLLNK